MKVFDKTVPGPSDHTVIMAVREGLVQPFDAGTWLDLRIGFLLSICGFADPGSDDVITGLAEDLGAGTDPANRFWIGVRNNGTAFPGSTGVVFIGYTDSNTLFTTHNSKLVSSDVGKGTTNSNYWRAENIGEIAARSVCKVTDGIIDRSSFPSIVHYAQDNIGTGGPAGYSTLIMLRLTRPNANVGAPVTITYANPSPFTSSDVLFTSTPTKTLLQANMESYPVTVSQLGPFTLSAVPDSFFIYWPFHLSRMRIHCAGIEVIA